MIWLIIMMFTVLLGQSDNLDFDMKEIGARLGWANRHADVRELALAIDRYQKLKGHYPTSLSNLSNEKGFENIKHHIRPDVRYRLEKNLGTSIVFDRAALVAWRGDKVGNAKQDIDKNGCGTGDFKTNGRWCPKDTALYAVFETRDFVNQDKTRLRLSLDKTISKFIVAYKGGFPNENGNLPEGSARTLPILAGYIGSAADCKGEFHVEKTLLNCQDLFTPWGEPIMYNLIEKNRIALVGATPHKQIINGVRQPIYIAQDIKIWVRIVT